MTKQALKLVLLAIVGLWLASPAALASLEDCVTNSSVITPTGLPGIDAIFHCGDFTLELFELEAEVSAPSSVSGTSVLAWLGQTSWLGPLQAADVDLSAMGSASAAVLLFSPEFLASGGTVSFYWEMSFEGPGYGEFGIASCMPFFEPDFDGPFNGFGPGGTLLDCSDPFSVAPPWGLSPLAGLTENMSGTFSDSFGPVPPVFEGYGLYMVVFSESANDPVVALGNLQVEPVPEPTTAWLLLGGVAVIMLQRRKIRKAA